MKSTIENTQRRCALFVCAAALLFACCGSAHAAISCTMPAGVALNFGTYDDSSASNLNVSTSFKVDCCRNGGGNGIFDIALGASFNSGQILTRSMKNTGNTDLMTYQLYSGSFGGTVWGDGVTGGSQFSQAVTVVTKCANGTQSIPVASAIFGQVTALQSVSAGTYADHLTITITP